MKAEFTVKLLKWNAEDNSRHMPWKGEKDPYKIWLSEVILQQTRVEQGLSYYEKFIKAFPTVKDLADAPEQEVFKLWEGLGYYSRCKNLIHSAKFIAATLQGKFPDTYEGIRALKGIGPYTAAAIGSFAFNLPYAVVDGNVLRVLSRYFGISTAIDTIEGKKLFTQLADALLDHEQPGIYNQAIMDFGAVVCKPQQPLCTLCVQQADCEAYKHNLIQQLPVKEKTLEKKTRWFYYYVMQYADKVYIRKRQGKDIWQNLHEFALQETNQPLELNDIIIMDHLKKLSGTDTAGIKIISRSYKQQLTHQNINGQFIVLSLKKPLPETDDFLLVPLDQLKHYAFPKFINSFLEETPELLPSL